MIGAACGPSGPEDPTPSPSPSPTQTATSTSIPPPSPTTVTVVAVTTVRTDPSPEPTETPTPSPTVRHPTATDTPLPPTQTPARVETSTPVPATPTAAPSGQYGGALRLVGRERIAHFDVHNDISPALSTWGPGIVYSRLMRFSLGTDMVLPSLAVECELCEGWEMSDETTFVFRLRDDVRWQDVEPTFGRSLDAEDIVFSYGRQREIGRPNAPILRGIRSIEAPAPDLLRITLETPDADFLLALADGHSKIVAREAVEINGDLMDGPTVGSGPWIWRDTRSDGGHTFVRNPDYFEAGLPFVDTLEIHVITDQLTRDTAFAVGLLDVIDLDPQAWFEITQGGTDERVLLAREPGTGLELAMNTSEAPFDDIGVRRAVFQAIDPWGAIADVWSDAAFVSLGLPAARSDWLLGDDEMRRYFGDPDLALDLLRSAGVDGPVPFTIKVGSFGQAYLDHADRVARELQRVGFDPSIEVVNRRIFGDEVWLGGGYQMFIGPIPPQLSPNGYLFSVLHSRGAWNTAGYGDEELDRLIEAQAIEYDPGRRRELALDIQRHVLDKAYRFMPATRVSVWTWGPRVRNFHPNFAGFEYGHWARVSISE